MVVSLKPVAGDRVADGQRKEAEPDGEHDDVQHEMLLANRGACRAGLLPDEHTLNEGQTSRRCSSGNDLPLTPYVFEKDQVATL
jgi:hypothetical protein